ncbi:MAG: nuclear transport factor 2 family protein [Actinophytocola sp.]|nr:nuclear transport factor 2 family protein [Actinophytocola sp.]
MTTTGKDETPSSTADDVEAADFVRRFAEAWANPSPDRLNSLVHPDVEFIQPLERRVTGHQQATRLWRRIFARIPDLHGEVLSWGFRDGIVYIELRLIGTLGGRPIEWVSLDRIQLDNGKVRQRVAYFDPLSLISTVLRRPRAWRRWIAAQRVRD